MTDCAGHWKVFCWSVTTLDSKTYVSGKVSGGARDWPTWDRISDESKSHALVLNWHLKFDKTYRKISVDLLSIFPTKIVRERTHLGASGRHLCIPIHFRFSSFVQKRKRGLEIKENFYTQLNNWNSVLSWRTLYGGIISDGAPPHFGINDTHGRICRHIIDWNLHKAVRRTMWSTLQSYKDKESY
jgi:hypothetical protein